MKFIADVMLGRLAKRLRLLGWDVLYDPDLSDNEIIRCSLEQGRVILTRDAALAARPLAKNHLFIGSELIREQIDQVLSSFPKDTLPLTRCIVCNGPCVSVKKEAVRDLVPIYVFETKEEFTRCEQCGRIYWKGTHVDGMVSRGMIKRAAPVRRAGRRC